MKKLKQSPDAKGIHSNMEHRHTNQNLQYKVIGALTEIVTAEIRR
jgi:hypothetical protein